MLKTNKLQKLVVTYRRAAVFGVAVGLAVTGLTAPLVSADRFDSQIRELQAANNQNQSQVAALRTEAGSLQATIGALTAQITGLQNQIIENNRKSAELEKEIAKLRGELEKNRLPELLAQKQVIGGSNVLIAQVDGVDGKQLRDIADQLKDKLGSGIVVLASAGGGNVNLVASVSKEMTKKYHAGNIVKELAGMVGGGGGGRPDFAQAGGKEPEKITAALKRAEEIVKQAS